MLALVRSSTECSHQLYFVISARSDSIRNWGLADYGLKAYDTRRYIRSIPSGISQDSSTQWAGQTRWYVAFYKASASDTLTLSPGATAQQHNSAFRLIRSSSGSGRYLWTGMQHLRTHSWVTHFTADDSRAAGYCTAGNFWNDSHVIRSLVVYHITLLQPMIIALIGLYCFMTYGTVLPLSAQGYSSQICTDFTTTFVPFI